MQIDCHTWLILVTLTWVSYMAHPCDIDVGHEDLYFMVQ